MVVCFIGGGTLGHIYPALSLIKTLKEMHDVKVLFIMTQKERQYEMIKNNPNIDRLYFIEAKGLSKNIFKNVKSFMIDIKAYKQIRKILKKEEVNILIGMGGYISGIGINCAHSLHIKTVIHEQNSVLGLANKMLLNKCNMILLTFPLHVKHKLLDKVYVVGNPRMNEAKSILLSPYKNSYNLLITSGSLGSKYINELAIEFLKSEYSKNFTTTLVTGKNYYDLVKTGLADINNQHFEILPFTNNMLELYNLAGIVISRAGSTSIFEIIGSRAVPILIPSPNVTSNHQYLNAKFIHEKHIGEMLEEKNATIDNLLETIKKIELDYISYYNQVNDYCNNISNEEIINLIIPKKERL